MPSEDSAWRPELLRSPHEAPDKAARVRRMFNRIAPRYELVNWLFSAGRDAAWRRSAVRLAAVCEDDVCLDIACGTGDFARAFASVGAKVVVGCDFAHQMLIRAAGFSPREPNKGSIAPRQAEASRRLKPAAQEADSRRLKPAAQFPRGPRIPSRQGGMGKRSEERAKLARADTETYTGKQVRPSHPLHWCEADALRLPFRSGSFSIASCAFGVRNFADLDAGLAEMFRVLRPGGRAVILEFSRPRNRAVRALYEFYSNRLMPVAATLISGDRSGAYRYLPRSVVSFLRAEEMCSRLRRVGFAQTRATPLTMGVVTVYVATRH